jgi:hypothetical protein
MPMVGEPEVMADQRGASVFRRDASTGGSSDVWGRRPGSVVDVGGTVVVVVVLVDPVVGAGWSADVDDPHPVAATARSIAPATAPNRGNV